MEARRYLGKTQIDRWKLLGRNRREDSSLLDIARPQSRASGPQARVEVGPWEFQLAVWFHRADN